MLKRFSVSNFKAFKDTITLDLSSPRDYTFNPHLIRNGIVKNGIIYGENGSGKSSLGKAIFDITALANIPNSINYGLEIYQGASDKPIVFEYCFQFDADELVYRYHKDSHGYITEERLEHNGQLIFEKSLPRQTIYISQGEFPVDNSRQDELLNSANSFSLINYLSMSFPLQQNHYLLKMTNFVKSMLWFRCLESRNYIGLDSGPVNIAEYIIRKGLVEQFALFVKSASGQEFDFSATTTDDKQLKCMIDGHPVLFSTIASTGTNSLELLYYWLIRMKEENVKFVFIDEFDAFYHYALSLSVCQYLFDEHFQVFLSSHNTLLLSNDNLRPDCAFLLHNGKIAPLSSLTDRGELRQGHNIEKMYRAGAFKQGVI